MAAVEAFVVGASRVEAEGEVREAHYVPRQVRPKALVHAAVHCPPIVGLACSNARERVFAEATAVQWLPQGFEWCLLSACTYHAVT